VGLKRPTMKERKVCREVKGRGKGSVLNSGPEVLNRRDGLEKNDRESVRTPWHLGGYKVPLVWRDRYRKGGRGKRGQGSSQQGATREIVNHTKQRYLKI